MILTGSLRRTVSNYPVYVLMFFICSLVSWQGFKEKDDILDKVVENLKTILCIYFTLKIRLINTYAC